jgi:hypothetical protein
MFHDDFDTHASNVKQYSTGMEKKNDDIHQAYWDHTNE